MLRIVTALLALAGVSLLSAGPASAQAWPAKPVRVVNTFAPGGAADFLARTAADGLSSAFGQQFYVETHAGAAGAIGVNLVASTPPDGYNFVLTNITMLVLAPISNPRLGYDPLRDLSNIAYIGGSPIVLSVNAKSGLNTLDDFIAFGKKSAKPLTYSSSGVGSSGHLFGELLGQKLGIRVEHVPYKGAAQGLADLVGGHIVFSAQTVSSTSGQLRAGTLRGIAQTADVRLPDYPDIPSFKELGFPELVSTTWFSLSGPAGLPDDIVRRVNREVVLAMTKPEAQQRLREGGLITSAMDVAQFNAFIAAEAARWKPVIERAGLVGK